MLKHFFVITTLLSVCPKNNLYSYNKFNEPLYEKLQNITDMDNSMEKLIALKTEITDSELLEQINALIELNNIALETAKMNNPYSLDALNNFYASSYGSLFAMLVASIAGSRDPSSKVSSTVAVVGYTAFCGCVVSFLRLMMKEHTLEQQKNHAMQSTPFKTLHKNIFIFEVKKAQQELARAAQQK